MLNNITFIIINFIFIVIVTERLIHEIKLLKYKKDVNGKIENLTSIINTTMTKPANTFDVDIKFLKDITKHVIDNFIVYKARPTHVANYKIDDELFAQWREEVIMEIYNKLSDNYKKNLLSYFSEQGLDEYIIEYVTTELLESVLSIKINKINGK